MRRIEKVEKEISRVIGELLRAEDSLISVTRTKLTKNLGAAHIFISIYSPNRDKIFSKIQDKEELLRRELASKLKLRYTPKLYFKVDEGLEHSDKIDKILEVLKRGEE